MIAGFVHDCRFAVRQISREPAFSLSVIAVLALIVGVTTGIISLLNALVLRPLPIQDPASLVVVSSTDERGLQPRPIYYRTYTEVARLPVFEALALYSGGGVLLTEARGVAGEGAIEAVTPGYFTLMGLTPQFGRFFTEQDAPGDGPSAPVVVITHRFWQRYYGGDPNAVGEQLTVSAVPLTIIGITPRKYTGLSIEGAADVLVPQSVLGRQLAINQFTGGPMRGLNLVGRLRQGTTLAHASAALETAWPQLRVDAAPAGLPANEQAELRTRLVKLESLATGFSTLRTRYRDPLWLLAGASVLLLLVGCVNLSGLLLTRAFAQHHSLLVRMTLGASRRRIAQQLLAHSLLLSLAGAALAVPLAWAIATWLLVVLWDSSITPAVSVTPDARVFAVLAAGAAAIGLLVSALPSLVATRGGTEPVRATRTVSSATSRWGRALLIAEVAISLVLLFGAGLFVRSLASLRDLDIGVRTEGVRWTRAFSQPGGYRAINDAAYYPALVERLSAVPGVTAVALSYYFPAYWNFANLATEHAMARTGAAEADSAVMGMMDFITPGFFAINGITLHAGRDVAWTDTAEGRAVTVINESLQRKLFPHGDAIGQRIRIGDEAARREVEVIGVVSDATVGGFRNTHQPVAFRPKAQEPRFRTPIILFRGDGDPAALDAAVTKAIFEMGHEYSRRIYSMDEQVEIALKQDRLLAALSSTFAGLAVVLAFIGIFSMLAYSVARRTREIGIRMALGASRDRVVRAVVRESLIVTLAGIAIGIPLALYASRSASALLHGLAPTDPWTLGAAVLLFIVVGVLAGLRPALAASKVDPGDALRTT
ncbi:MAG: ADOP family duplicated permease [Acidobacteriota bacterium]|nr:ADOP family duplicated permease [Acidobacteriota bacterium]